MMTVIESPPPSAASILFVGRPLPDGTQVLVPQLVRPRTCRRLDGVTKIAYASRAEAKGARTKHDSLYRCPHCGHFHLATRNGHRLHIAAPTSVVAKAA